MNKPFNKLDIAPEDEIAIFEEGKKSLFWQTLKLRFDAIVKGAQSSLKSVDCANRDFIAGKVNALESVFNYPEKHIFNLKKILEKKDEVK